MPDGIADVLRLRVSSAPRPPRRPSAPRPWPAATSMPGCSRTSSVAHPWTTSTTPSPPVWSSRPTSPAGSASSTPSRARRSTRTCRRDGAPPGTPRTGQVLQRRLARDPELLGEVARHHAAASAYLPEAAADAVAYGTQAAAAAERRGAFEEAVRTVGTRPRERAPRAGARRRTAPRPAAGAGRGPATDRDMHGMLGTLEEAVELAQRHGDHRRMAEAITGHRSGGVWHWRRSAARPALDRGRSRSASSTSTTRGCARGSTPTCPSSSTWPRTMPPRTGTGGDHWSSPAVSTTASCCATAWSPVRWRCSRPGRRRAERCARESLTVADAPEHEIAARFHLGCSLQQLAVAPRATRRRPCVRDRPATAPHRLRRAAGMVPLARRSNGEPGRRPRRAGGTGAAPPDDGGRPPRADRPVRDRVRPQRAPRCHATSSPRRAGTRSSPSALPSPTVSRCRATSRARSGCGERSDRWGATTRPCSPPASRPRSCGSPATTGSGQAVEEIRPHAGLFATYGSVHSLGSTALFVGVRPARARRGRRGARPPRAGGGRQPRQRLPSVGAGRPRPAGGARRRPVSGLQVPRNQTPARWDPGHRTGHRKEPTVSTIDIPAATASVTDTWESLRTRVSGRLVTRDDPDYALARTPWIVNVDQRPAAVLEVAQVADVVEAVRWAIGPRRDRSAHSPTGTRRVVRSTTPCCCAPAPCRASRSTAPAAPSRVGAGVKWGELLRRPRRHRPDGARRQQPRPDRRGPGAGWRGQLVHPQARLHGQQRRGPRRRRPHRRAGARDPGLRPRPVLGAARRRRRLRHRGPPGARSCSRRPRCTAASCSGPSSTRRPCCGPSATSRSWRRAS